MSLVLEAVEPANLDTPALIDERGARTWREADTMLNRAANAMLKNVAAGERVGVFTTNCAEAILAYVAALAAGRSSVPINSHLTAPELVYILRDANVRVLFVGPECRDVAVAGAREVGGVFVVGWRCTEGDGVRAWEDWLDAASAAEPPSDMPPAAHLHYTSGTTGRPKAVETPPTMFPNVASVRALFEAFRKDVAAGPKGAGIAVGPLYHTGPLRLARLFAGGSPVVTMERFDAEKFLANVEKYGVVRTVMVPTHFQRLLALPEEVRRKYDASSLKLISHTGAACPVDVKRRMIEWLGPILVESYGGTESGPTNMITSPEWLERPGSVGKAVAPYEIVVVGDDDKPLDPNQEGRVYFHDKTGRGVQFYNDPEKTKSVHLAPGLFTLGEVGYLDDAGYLFITDRASDMIVSGGVNIYPAEVEQALLLHPAVEDVAVIGAPNRDMGEEVKALVVLKPGAAAPDHAAFDRHCRASLAGYKCPRSYEIVETVGRNAMGKVNKRQLRRPYWPNERTIG